MSISLPTTPFERPFLSVDTGGYPSTSASGRFHDNLMTDSPAPFTPTSPPNPEGRASSAFPREPSSSRPQSGQDGDSNGRNGASSGGSSSTRIFTQLEKIKALQAAIAKEHAALEGIGGPGGGDMPGFAAWSGRAGEGAAEGTKEGDKAGGVDAGLAGRTKEEKEKVGKSYQLLADQFAEREGKLDGLMAKLSELSTALKTFHSLPAPSLFPHSASSDQPSSSHHPTSPAAVHPFANPDPQADRPSKSDTAPARQGGGEDDGPKAGERKFTLV
ncbi:hypothetical protein JCM5296_006410 [Sporobolomyces johnsonii]